MLEPLDIHMQKKKKKKMKESTHFSKKLTQNASYGWGIHVNPWLIHVNVWQKPLQYCKVISLQLIKIKINKLIK